MIADADLAVHLICRWTTHHFPPNPNLTSRTHFHLAYRSLLSARSGQSVATLHSRAYLLSRLRQPCPSPPIGTPTAILTRITYLHTSRIHPMRRMGHTNKHTAIRHLDHIPPRLVAVVEVDMATRTRTKDRDFRTRVSQVSTHTTLIHITRRHRLRSVVAEDRRTDMMTRLRMVVVVVAHMEVREEVGMRRSKPHPSDPLASHHRARLDRHRSPVIQDDRSPFLVLEVAVEVAAVLEVR